MSVLINHEGPAREFLAAMASGRIPHAWMLSGQKGIGKAHFAHQAAMTLLDWNGATAAPEMLADASAGQAARLIAAGAHPDFHLLECLPRDEKLVKDVPRNEWPADAERRPSIGVAQVRALIAKLALKPALGLRHVIIIDALDNLEREGANALLKILEEPQGHTVFLCIAHAPDRLLPTIRSRCRMLRFAALDEAQMADALLRMMPNRSHSERSAIAALAEGSPGRALACADADYAAIMDLLKKIVAKGDADLQLRLVLSHAVSGKNARPAYQAMIDLAPHLAADVARKSTASSAAFAALAAHEQLVALGQQGRLDPSMAAMIGFEVGSIMAGLHQPH